MWDAGPLDCTLSICENIRELFCGSESAPALALHCEHFRACHNGTGSPWLSNKASQTELLSYSGLQQTAPFLSPHLLQLSFSSLKMPAGLFHQGTQQNFSCFFFCILYLRSILVFCSFIEKVKTFKTQVVARRERQGYYAAGPWAALVVPVLFYTLHIC